MAANAAALGEVSGDRRRRQLTIGCSKFNEEPEKGIAYLREHRLLPESAQGVAGFLQSTEGLSKKAIGHFLGEPESFNQEVLAAFVQRHDFSEKLVLPALRQLLGSFWLPGEGQKIARVITCFAQRYCQLNPVPFSHADDCAVLCNALLLLNTLLHNPSVKERPTVDCFVKMVRQAGREVLPRARLVTLFDSVREQPFQVPADDGPDDLALAFRDRERGGWLCKQCRRLRFWKWRWFVLKDNCLYYFAEKGDTRPLGVVPLVNVRLRVVLDKSKQYCFELYSDAGLVAACESLRGLCGRQLVPGKHAAYRIAAGTVEDMTEWMQALTGSIVRHAGHPRQDAGNPRQDAGHPRQDAGNPRQDAGNPRQDAGHLRLDAGHPWQDAGNPRLDAGNPRQDAGHPRQDAGHPRQDAGNPRQDAGHPRLDAGHPRQDAGNPRQDAGHPRQDAGNPRQDAGHLRQDAGHPRQDAGNPRQDAGHLRQDAGRTPPSAERAMAGSQCQERIQKGGGFAR